MAGWVFQMFGRMSGQKDAAVFDYQTGKHCLLFREFLAFVRPPPHIRLPIGRPSAYLGRGTTMRFTKTYCEAHGGEMRKEERKTKEKKKGEII